MKPWDVIGRTRTPDGSELLLRHHSSEYIILLNGQSLMSSRMHESEDALAVLGCHHARMLARPRVLVGGLGMGFTLRAALDVLPRSAFVHVVELIPAVVEWNQGPLGALAGHPLADPRVRIELGDVRGTMRSSQCRFDIVLLDVDNGPVALTVSSNAGLYDGEGVAVARASLRPGGVLAVWSPGDDRAFERRLRAAAFRVQRRHVSGRPNKGPRHTVVVARIGDAPSKMTLRPRRRDSQRAYGSDTARESGGRQARRGI